MATQGDVKPLGQYVVERVASSSTPKTISANSTGGSLDFPIAKSGKTAIGIVGICGNGTSALAFEDLYLADNATARLWVRNVTGSAVTITNMYVDVLYRVD